MAEHSAIGISKILEEMLQVSDRIGKTMNGKRNIFVDAGGSAGTHATDGRDDAFARLP